MAPDVASSQVRRMKPDIGAARVEVLYNTGHVEDMASSYPTSSSGSEKASLAIVTSTKCW